MTLTTLQLSKSGHSVGLRDHGKGHPLLLIHGVGMQSAAWGPQIDILSQTHRVIAVDMPGHGISAPLDADSQLPDYVTWLHDVVQTLNLGQVSVAGHSMGALIAGGFAATHPELTARAALLNGVYRRSEAARAAVSARAAEIRAGKVDLDTPLSRWFGDTPVEREARAQVAAWLDAVDQGGYTTAYSAFAHGDATYADRLSGITCPFLAITGDRDPNSTPAMSQAMANEVQDGQAITIEGHRHMVNLTAPDAVTSHLTAWLKRTAVQKESQ